MADQHADTVAYGSHHDQEIVEAYENAVARLRAWDPVGATRFVRYVEEFLGTHNDGTGAGAGE
jgi:hypothetical protein